VRRRDQKGERLSEKKEVREEVGPVAGLGGVGGRTLPGRRRRDLVERGEK